MQRLPQVLRSAGLCFAPSPSGTRPGSRVPRFLPAHYHAILNAQPRCQPAGSFHGCGRLRCRYGVVFNDRTHQDVAVGPVLRFVVLAQQDHGFRYLTWFLGVTHAARTRAACGFFPPYCGYIRCRGCPFQQHLRFGWFYHTARWPETAAWL